METDKIFPANWKEIIQGKKVIFYNTGVTSLLQGQEKRIEKMKWVFDVFKEHPEVVLWWRPHPLELSTIQSMIPDLEEQYMKVRRRFREENIGILDESADLYRAIAISDAYYGAWSSIVELYKVTKKPVLWENNFVYNAISEKILAVMDFVYCNRYIWFVCAIYNYLFAMDIDNKCISKIIRLPIGYPFSAYTIKYILKVGNELVLIPQRGDRIIKYNTDKEEFVFDTNSILNLFVSVYQENEYIIYGVTGRNDFVYKYDLKTNTYMRKKVGRSGEIYIGIHKISGKFIITQLYNEKIIVCNEKFEKIQDVVGFPNGYTVKYPEFPFTDMVSNNDNILIFPKYANMILEMDVKNLFIRSVVNNYIPYHFNRGMIFSCAKKVNNIILVYANYTYKWIIYNDYDRTVEELDISLTEKQWANLYQNNLFDRKACDISTSGFCEGEDKYIFTLKKFIHDMYENVRTESKDIGKKQCGYQIYTHLLDELEEDSNG